MGKINSLLLKIVLGIFAATNFIACIITTDLRVLVPLNLVVAAGCLGLFVFINAQIGGLSRDLGISRREAARLIGDYFAYYKNVERVSIDEYLKRRASG